MAAGLGFKTFTTGEVLTAADTNGYLMQGVLVFASAAARDAAITSPQEGQFAYLKDTNVTTYYTGAAWANLDTTGMTNPMTTTGDTIYSSSGSTPARLGIGTAGQVLTVNSGATAPEWAAPAGGGAWQDYTPTYTNFTPGNATIVARYSQTGKVVTVFFSVIFGSTSSISGTPNVSLPANTVAGFEEMVVVFGKIEDVGTSFLVGGAMIVHSGQTFRWQYFPTNANDLTSANVSSTAPFTWVTGDKYSTTFTYEAA